MIDKSRNPSDEEHDSEDEYRDSDDEQHDTDDNDHNSDEEEHDGGDEDSRTIREESLAMFFRKSSGPLPSPDAFREYEDVLPGAADRILGMAEFQLHHRASSQKMGLGIMFILAIGFLIVSSALAVLTTPAAAVLFPVIPTLVSGGAYVYGLRKRSEPPRLPSGDDDDQPKLPPSS